MISGVSLRLLYLLCECRCGAPGWRTAGSVSVTRRDSRLIWPFRRALSLTVRRGRRHRLAHQLA